MLWERGVGFRMLGNDMLSMEGHRVLMIVYRPHIRQ